MLRCPACLRGVSTLHTDASGTAPPDAFGPFRVLHQIGAGVLGPVFRAYQPDPGRLVAVKLFRLDVSPDIVHRFVAALERLIAADLTYLGIAAPLAAGISDAWAFLAMDFVAADSFDVVMRDYGPAPVAESLRIATQLGGALDFAAAVKVYHGALHPRDVLVTNDDTRVTGLGVAQALESVGIAAPVRRPYSAPERVAGLPWDRRADVFSLAALVSEMLCGRRIAGLGREAADAMPEIAGADQEALRAVFAKALAEGPDERYDTALGFVEALHGAFRASEGKADASPRRRRRDASSGRRAASRPTPTVPLPLEADADAAADAPLLLNSEPADVAGAAGTDRLSSTPDADLDTFVRVPAADAPEPPAILMAPASEEEIPPPVMRRAEPDVEREAPFAHHEPPRFAAIDEPEVPLRSQLDEGRTFGPDDSLSVDEAAIAATSTDTPTAPTALDEGEHRGRAADMPLRPTGRTAEMPPQEPQRAGLWPIALALAVGLLVGFAGGFSVASRDRVTQDEQVGTTTAAPGEPAAAPGAPDAALTPAPATQPAATPGAGPAPVSPPPSSRPAPPSASPTAVPGRDRAAARTETGRILVRSTPAGASVTVDGRDVGSTPVTVRDLARGTHVLRIAHQGYVTAERRVRISTAQPAQSIAVDLVAARARREASAPPAGPERTSGSLMLDSRPTGARVLVDGKLVGTTPMLLDSIAVGDHAVRLELDGFTPWTTTARVTGGERTRVSGSLEQR